jgi:hypothetical protein
LSIVNKREWLYLLSFYADVHQTKYFYAWKISIHWLLTYCLTSILTYIIFTVIYFIPNKQPHTGCAISKETQKILNSSITDRPTGSFFTKDRGMFTIQIYTDKVSENLCWVSLLISIRKFYFCTDREKTLYRIAQNSLHRKENWISPLRLEQSSWFFHQRYRHIHTPNPYEQG